MNEWVLIITLFSTNYGGSAITTQVFVNKDRCYAAMNTWEKSIPRDEERKYYRVSQTPRAVCVAR